MKAFAILALACLPAASAALAITDVTVIDVITGAARPHLTVVMEGERISAVGPSASTPVINARIVSGTGKFLIPGLWDMHVHLWHEANELPVFVAFGVTGVQDMGSDFRRVAAWRDEIETGKAVGPHVLTSGPPVTGQLPSGDLPVILAGTPAEARHAFDQLWALDVDFLNVLPSLPRDAYFALAEQARHWDLRLVGQAPAEVTVWEAVEARQRGLEGLSGVMRAVSTDSEAIDFFEQCALKGVRLSPELASWRNRAEASTEQTENAYRLVELMKRTNVEVLAATATGEPHTVPGASLHDELEQLVAAGMEPHQALQAATIAPARFLEWDEAMGTIEKGKLADLVMLNANPLSDIRNTRKIAAVFTRGRYHSRKDLDAILAEAGR